MVKCLKCGLDGTLYYARQIGKGGKAYFYKYVRHSDAVRKGEIISKTCKLGSVGEAEYNARSKRLESKDKIDLNPEEIGVLRKLHERLIEGRNTSQAKVIKRILESISS